MLIYRVTAGLVMVVAAGVGAMLAMGGLSFASDTIRTPHVITHTRVVSVSTSHHATTAIVSVAALCGIAFVLFLIAAAWVAWQAWDAGDRV